MHSCPRVLRLLILLLGVAQAALPAAVSVLHARDAAMESASPGTSRIEAPGQHDSHALPTADCGLCSYVAASFGTAGTPEPGPALHRHMRADSGRLAISARAGEGLLPPPRAPPVA